ncbi:MAG: TAXI family TRAP transporter solute-binding subunit, partial [Alphaproteobacteria bacterium]|nr:TAXI family TRAP transporter solute-binding subunit [Alphaproteobacteria bacterium]
IGSSLGGFRPLFAQKAPLRWGSASLGSTGYVIIEALASTVNRLTDVKGSSIATTGAVENMALLGRKEIDLGQTTSMEWPIAYKGEAPFKQKIEPVQLLSYAIWSLHPLVRADSPIKTMADLAGKRISPGPSGGITALLWKILFTKAGLNDKVRWSYASWRETYDGVKAGALDCIGSILVDGRPSSILKELETTVKMKPVKLERSLIEAVQKDYPGAMLYTVPPDRWSSLDGPLDTPAASGILGARPEIDNATGYTIVKTVYDNAEEIRKISPDLAMIRPELATKFLLAGYPVNGGAAKYYKEKGVWRSDLTERS